MGKSHSRKGIENWPTWKVLLATWVSMIIFFLLLYLMLSIGNTLFVYVVDGLFHNVQIFDRQGRFLAHFGQQGRAPGEFWMPSGIFIDDSDKIYVADTYNSRVQVFELEVAD